MMNKIKKACMITAAAAVLAAAVSGCGAKQGGQAQGAAQAQTENAAQAENGAKQEQASANAGNAAAAAGDAAANAGGAAAEGSLKPGEENLGEFAVWAEDGVIDMPQFGMRIVLPESMRSDEYRIGAVGYVEESFAYANIYLADGDNEEYTYWDITEIMAHRSPFEMSEVASETMNLTPEMLVDLGSNGTLYYAAVLFDKFKEANSELFESVITAEMPEEQKNIYYELISHSEELLAGVELTDLTLPEMMQAARVGGSTLMEMPVFDLSEKEVRLGDMIAQNKVTMLNFWGTFCGPCIREMPDLGELEREYKDRGFEILGLTSDIVDGSGAIQKALVEDAEGIIADTKITYPVLITSRELLEYGEITVLPTTYFVDSEGNMLGDPLLGSRSKEDWERIITGILDSVE